MMSNAGLGNIKMQAKRTCSSFPILCINSQIFPSTMLLNFLKCTPVLYKSLFCSWGAVKILIFVRRHPMYSFSCLFTVSNIFNFSFPYKNKIIKVYKLNTRFGN